MSDGNTPSTFEALEGAASSNGRPPESSATAVKSSAISNEVGKPDVRVLGFRLQDRRAVTVLTAILLVWLSVEWIWVAMRRPDPLLLKRGAEFQNQFRVEVNEATWVEWLQLEGIGPSLAHRIVADRRLNGPFSSIEDVARVPGIGPGTLDRIRPWLTIGHDANDSNADARERTPER